MRLFFIIFFAITSYFCPVIVNSHTLPDIVNRGEYIQTNPKINTVSDLQETVTRYLSRRSLPAGSDYVVAAEQLIERYQSLFLQVDLNWQDYILAIIDQYNHNYQDAIHRLRSVSPSSNFYINSQLILARTYTMVGRGELARQVCQKLLLKASSEITLLCLFDASNSQDEQLFSLIKTRFKSMQSVQLLAEYYQQTDDFSAAYVLLENFLSENPYADIPVAYWAQWADMALQTQRAHLVVERLPQLYLKPAYVDDALLLRITEASLLSQNNKDNAWLGLLQQRMHYRIHNQASAHAYELSRF